MSSKAMEFAWRSIAVVKGSTHHLLLAICENVPHEHGLAFPSIAGLMEMTGQDRKTVIANIDRLLEKKLMKDTGAKAGKTRQIPVYQLAPWVKDWADNQTVGKTGLFEFADDKGPDSPAEESHISGEQSQKRDTDPSIGPKEGVLPPTPNGVDTPGDELFADLPEQEAHRPLEDLVLEGWAEIRKAHPHISEITALSPARVKKIRARAADGVKARAKLNKVATPESIWREIFDQIGRSRFLTGRSPPGRGYARPFKLTIDYVLRQGEFFNILDGGHDDGDKHGPGRSYDGESGRDFGPAEQALRGSLDRLFATDECRA